MITWKRIEPGLYQLYDNDTATDVHVYKERYSWWSGIMENGHLIGDGIYERRLLKQIKETIAEKYSSGKY